MRPSEQPLIRCIPEMDRYLMVYIITALMCFSFRDGSCIVICRKKERRALLRFKDDLADPSNRLRSWSAEAAECCRWAGVVCDNSTRRVAELRLHGRGNHIISTRSTTLNPSLLHLRSLSRLDLGGNNFSGVQIPKFLGSMTGLAFLDLSDSGFQGLIPHEIGNLSALQYLNLSNLYGRIKADSIRWLSTLPSLECLDLSFAGLENASRWEESVSALHHLTELHLSSCSLSRISHAQPSSVNLSSSLRILDLSKNEFGSLAPNWVFELIGLVHLDLRSNNFYGSIPPGIQNMSALRYLDLSRNQFNSSISSWICNVMDIEYLDLSYNELSGTLCDTMENLSSLHALKLSNNYVDGKIPRSFQQLCKLKELDLSGLSIEEEISLVINNLPIACFSNELTSLDLSSTQLYGPLHDALDKLAGQMKNLESLILPNNSISGPLPSSLGQFHSLKVFDVSMNKLSGSLPQSIGSLKNLWELDVSSNNFSGSLPQSIGGLKNLRKFYVSSNKFTGSLPQSIGGLENLIELRFGNNSFSEAVSEAHLKNLTSLTYLTANGNPLAMRAPSEWVPPFQLTVLLLGSWQLGPGFPMWVCSQQSLQYLVMSNTQISGTLPPCLWSLPSLQLLSLKNNTINGSLPNWIPTLSYLDLSGNLLSGYLSPFLCHAMGNPMALSYLNLSDNHLTGNIPECWARWPGLRDIYLENNRLTGSIPASLGLLRQLTTLRLSNNRLSGEIPKSLQNCTDMLILNLRNNEFGGMIPRWLGRMTNLKLLNLRKNKFHGNIPDELCQLRSVQILDVAENNLSGPIPKCFVNFSGMGSASDWFNAIPPECSIKYATYRPCLLINIYEDVEWAPVVAKGRELFYRNTQLVKILDLSDNNLCGHIPRELTGLVGLISLNLSRNHLSGSIPGDIGEMRWMESLDLSWNQLSGEIPLNITALNFLSYLDLSHNNLKGRIPTGTQIQSMNESGFMGNHLYGPPLTPNTTIPPNNTVLISGEEGRDKIGDIVHSHAFYVSMALGFWVGLCGVIGALFLNRSWRDAGIRFTEGLVCR